MESPFRTDEGIISFAMYLIMTIATFAVFFVAFVAMEESTPDMPYDSHEAVHMRKRYSL